MFTEDQKAELINWYFAYPIKDGEDSDYVLQKLMEFHKTDEIELEEALLDGESLKEFYDSEVRNHFIETGNFDIKY
jgi:hypothetical protein